MDSNTLAMIGVGVVAIVLILLAVWFSKSRKRDLDKVFEEREQLREREEHQKEQDKLRETEAEPTPAPTTDTSKPAKPEAAKPTEPEPSAAEPELTAEAASETESVLATDESDEEPATRKPTVEETTETKPSAEGPTQQVSEPSTDESTTEPIAEEVPEAEPVAEPKAEPVAAEPEASESESTVVEPESVAVPVESAAEAIEPEPTAAEPESVSVPVEAEPEPSPAPTEPAPVEPEPTPAPAPEPVPVPAKPKAEAPEKVGSRLTRLKEKLAKSSNPFGKALFNILAKDNLSEADWEDVEDTLLLADVGAEASMDLVDDLRTDARVTGKTTPDQVRAALKEKLLDLVGRDTDRRLNADKPGANKPSVIIMVGVNGTGKTTTAGKLARLFVSENKKVVMGAADTFRAAAADQLETWGARVNVPVVRSDKDGADPASVAFEASAKAKEAGADVLIIDTAGRLQNKANLMDELGKIRRVTEKNLPVDEVLLVLDATTGQNGMTQAKVFAEAIGITGVVLSKLDGSAKGGIVVSVQKALGVPVKLVGLGEGPDDLAPFDPEGFVDGILA